jgi:hypothetical protein
MAPVLDVIRECLELAEATADEAFTKPSDIAGLSTMFLARAGQSLLSVGILSERGLIADAMSVGRTVVEMSIDFAYIAKDPAVRIAKFESYDHVSKFKLAKAVDKLHGGKAPQAVMTTLKQRHDIARANNPDSTLNWAGKSLKDRATEVGREKLYELPYAEMCGASHSCYGTLGYALVEIDSSPKIHFGAMAPSTRPITLAVGAMAQLIAAVIDACGLESAASLRDRLLAIAERVQAAMTTSTTPDA